ncbi:hypothetical protein E9993_18150 [Labilibacter sediminis]|nr:hypothetical protein E9993_18150 [Labilibacter sediminis]
MMKKLLFALSIVFLTQTMGFAQAPVKETAETDSTKQTFWKKHNVNFAAVPVISYDPALGFNMAALTNVFFDVNPNDTISPLSMAGAMVGYTTNKSWYWALYTKMYFDEDNYRLTLAYGDASVNFQYQEPGYDEFINFNSLHDIFVIEAQCRVYKRWYLGAKYFNQKIMTSFDIEGAEAEKKNMTHWGLVISHDSRDFIYNPHSGDYLNFKTGHYRDAWGSDYKFDKYEFDFTKFFGLSKKEVIATRATALIATGDVPFEGQYVVGRDDIRGYTNGKHRAEQVYNLQAEYRYNFYKKWGMVGFAGVATAVNSPGEIKFKDLLPGAGVGVRYMAIPSEKINIGVDVAVGQDDWGLYFRIAETFGDK